MSAPRKNLPVEAIAAALRETAAPDGTWRVHVAARELDVQPSTLKKHIVWNGLEPPDVGVVSHEEGARIRKLEVENADLRRQQQQLLDRTMQDEEIQSLFAALHRSSLQPPKWLAPKTPSRKERAMVSVAFSDLHYDEVVRPEQIDFVNAYDREIATARTRRFTENVIRISRDYIAGIEVEGLVLNLLGDCLSGNIHEELVETNADTIIGSVLYWSEQMTAVVRTLAEHFPKIFIPCVAGNHGRLTRKPRAKFRAQDNFDYLLYHMIARETRDLDHVTWAISEGPDYRYDVYETKYCISHGDQFRGGSGIAGLFSPLMLGHHRKSRKEASKGRTYDHLVIGHWHQLRDMGPVIVNGSLKGADEYGEVSNFEIEQPEQALWLTDPQHGRTIFAPVHVAGEDEWWRSAKVAVT